jgi:hypothetical protein
VFEGAKALASLAGLVKDLPRLKARLEEMKERLGGMTVSGETGGGAVRVTASGLMRIVAIEVDPALMQGLIEPDRPGDRALGQDLIAAAVNAALERARELAERELAAAASQLGLPLPPGALGGLIR